MGRSVYNLHDADQEQLVRGLPSMIRQMLAINHLPDPIGDKFIDLQLQVDNLKKEVDALRNAGK